MKRSLVATFLFNALAPNAGASEAIYMRLRLFSKCIGRHLKAWRGRVCYGT
jgi:hypothetical protein